MSSSTNPASPSAPLAALKESTSDSLMVAAGDTEAAAVAPMVLVDRVSSAPTVLLMGATQVVTQPTASSVAVCEMTGATELILKTAASPGSAPQDVPSPASSTGSRGDTAEEKVQ